jgi:dihydrofolate reductase
VYFVTRLTFDVSVSLDGYITGPNPREAEPLGDGGDRLHEWMAGLTDLRAERRKSSDTVAAQVIAETYESVGALVMGRAMFDAGEEPWGDDPPFGLPVFVVTHRPRDTDAREGGTTYHFVTEGPESALDQARAAAGDEDVLIAGGADLIRQYARAGEVDEFQLHLIPIVLGGGVRLFDGWPAGAPPFEPVRVAESRGATHLRYRVVS